MTAKDPNQELNPYPVTRAYMEKTDFVARIDAIWQEEEEKLKRIIAGKRRLGLALDEEEAELEARLTPRPGVSAGP